MSCDVATASNALAGMVFSSSSMPTGHPARASPWKYHGEPLSASTSPYCLIARSTVRVSAR